MSQPDRKGTPLPSPGLIAAALRHAHPDLAAEQISTRWLRKEPAMVKA